MDRPAGRRSLDEPDDRPELSAEDSAALASLMSIEDVTQRMIGFLA
jgi:hypothetical protein